MASRTQNAPQGFFGILGLFWDVLGFFGLFWAFLGFFRAYLGNVTDGEQKSTGRFKKSTGNYQPYQPKVLRRLQPHQAPPQLAL